MPELPEVETARRLAARRLVGRRLVRVVTVSDRLVFEGTSPRRFAEALRGRRVRAVRRRGKHLWIELERRPWPLLHFGMSGGLVVCRDGEPPPRFWKLQLVTDQGTRIAFTDPRRLGRLRLREDPLRQPPLVGLGFDPLEGLPPAREIARLLERRAAPIKATLLDQSLFAGVGNWLADEVLYQARLDPRRRSSSLSRDEIARLRARLASIVKRAVAVGADSDRFPRGWLFRHRWGRRKGARTARGERIVHHTIGGRTTAWVPSRQR